jgi:hypothetical protein
VGLFLEEKGVFADQEEVAALEPTQALPPHEAWLERNLHSMVASRTILGWKDRGSHRLLCCAMYESTP